jgi:hypothetical protein
MRERRSRMKITMKMNDYEEEWTSHTLEYTSMTHHHSTFGWWHLRISD